jgi:hypothetical protein
LLKEEVPEVREVITAEATNPLGTVPMYKIIELPER